MITERSRNDWGVQIAHRFVDFDETPQVVTRQQIAHPAFYQTVRADILAGRVTVLDGTNDGLVLDGEPVPFNDPRAAAALRESQLSWVGQPPAFPSAEG